MIPGVVDCNGDPVPGYNGLSHTTIDGVNALVWTEDSRSFVFAGDVSVPQLLSYLRLGGFRLGFILNFHVAHMRDGIVRMLNGF